MASKTISSTENRRRRQSGATIVEYLTAVAVGSLLLAALVSLTFYTARTFAAQVNYADMNRASLLALDQMSKDIRQAVALISYSTNQMTFSMGTNQPILVYSYHADSRELVRESGAERKVLLTGCTSTEFSLFQRTPIGGSYNQFPPASLAECKAVSVKWVCSRSMFGREANSQAVQEAKIVMRTR